MGKTYRLSTLSGFAEWHVPTFGDAKVARIASVGLTQRVASCFANKDRPCGATTRSIVRSKCHMPLRKTGPVKESVPALDSGAAKMHTRPSDRTPPATSVPLHSGLRG